METRFAIEIYTIDDQIAEHAKQIDGKTGRRS